VSAIEGQIIVGVLGQWASGKSTAARILIDYLGGDDQVVFLNDQVAVTTQVVSYVLGLGKGPVSSVAIEGGLVRWGDERAGVWLRPGEDLRKADLRTLHFEVRDDVLPRWLMAARVELGHQICARCREGKPVVVEAGFGKRPPGHTIADLFASLEETGVQPARVKWIVVECGYDKRAERNHRRRRGPPDPAFARLAVDGGDLEPKRQARLAEQGVSIRRVANDHDDLERLKADIIAAFEEMSGATLPTGQADTEHQQEY
jgi:hypothetical protein